jgi:hypothetical protein
MCGVDTFAEKGYATRRISPFEFIEHAFFARPHLADLTELNAHTHAFCEKVNAIDKDHLHASPRELLAAERPHRRPLRLVVPEGSARHQRLVEGEGDVNVHGHRYCGALARDRTRRCLHDGGRGAHW